MNGYVFLFSVVALFAVAFVVWQLILQSKETALLKKHASEISGNASLPKQKLESLLNFLHTHISWQGLNENARRPLLRANATEILFSGKGFCGENTRVAILLMNKMNIRAGRFYLTGKKWGHVLSEYLVDDKWWLFDGHLDPATKMTSERVCTIESPDFHLLRNENVVNPYTGFFRIKIFNRISFLKSLDNLRPPKSIVIISESPHMVKAIVGLLLCVASVIAIILVYGN